MGAATPNDTSLAVGELRDEDTPFAEIEAIKCLFTEATPTRATIEDNIRAGGYAAPAPVLFDELVSAGWILPAVSNRARFRLAADMLTADCDAPTVAPVTEATSGPRFSLFRGGITSVRPCGDTTPAELYADLTSGRLRPQTERLRAVGRGAPEYSHLKNGLDYVTPGGSFSRRAEAGLTNASGLLVLDFDKLPNVPDARAALLSDPKLGPVVALLFTSPSGDGLKCLLPIDTRFSHQVNFDGYSRYLSHKYAALGLIPDASGRDISRACYLAHDPEAYLNPLYQHLNKLAA